jgi:DNA-binding response OmpR family regulator
VVEDDYGVSRAIALLLRHSGFQATVAASVAEAMEKLNGNPAWVILDLMLPDGSGAEVLRFIRRHHLPIKVVVTTGTGDERLIADVLSLAPEHYMTKPLEFAKLLAALR